MIRNLLCLVLLVVSTPLASAHPARSLPSKSSLPEARLNRAYDLNGRRMIDKEGMHVPAFSFEFGYGQRSWAPATVPEEFFSTNLAHDARILETPPPTLMLDGDDTPRSDMVEHIRTVAARTGLQGKMTNVWNLLLARGQKRPLEAFEKLGRSGKLDTSRAYVGAQTLGEILEIIAEACERVPDDALQERLRLTFVQLLVELADPSSICQFQHHTCGSASLQIALVLTNPAEYARIVGLLAFGSKVQLAGQKVVLKPWRNALDFDKAEMRSLPSRLFQNALVRLNHGLQTKTMERLSPTQESTSGDDLRFLFSCLTGSSARQETATHAKAAPSILALLKEARPSEAAPVFLSYRVPAELSTLNSSHWVVVTGISTEGRIQVIDPMGVRIEYAAASLLPFVRGFVAPQRR